MNEAQVSILVPMRNAERYVEAALRSILAQTGVNLEIIVIDDGGTDSSRQIVEGLNDARLRIIAGPQAGISAAMNAGLSAARSPLLARCDADDLYPPDRLARQMQWLDAHPEFAAVCGSFQTITPAGKPAGQLRFSAQAEEITPELLTGTARTHLCTYLMRTQALRDLGGFRPWFKTAEDIDLQFRLAEMGRIFFQPDGAYLYRLHDESITHRQPNSQRMFFEQCAKQFLQERRAGGQDALQRSSPPPIPVADQSSRQSSSVHLQKMLLGTAWDEHRRGLKRQAVFTGLRACFMRPGNLSAWKSLVLLMIKPV